MVLDEEYSGFDQNDSDEIRYTLGRISDHRVVINCPPDGSAGILQASRIASNMKTNFPCIHFTLIVGIGGGAPSLTNDMRLGDVIFGTSVVPYRFGRMTEEGFQSSAIPVRTCDQLSSAITYLEANIRRGLNLTQEVSNIVSKFKPMQRLFERTEHDHLYDKTYRHSTECHCRGFNLTVDALRLIKRNSRLDTELVQMHKGAIGSADQVMKNAEARDDEATKGDFLCFDMESAGLLSTERFLPVRGISDYSDGHKTDAWHNYASFAAAVGAKELLKTITPRIAAKSPADIQMNQFVDSYASMLGAVRTFMEKPDADNSDSRSDSETTAEEPDELFRKLAYSPLMAIPGSPQDWGAHLKKRRDLMKALETQKDLRDQMLRRFNAYHSGPSYHQ